MNNGEGSPAATPTDVIATLVSVRMQARQPLVDRYTALGASTEDRAGALRDFQQQFRADATPWTNEYPRGMFTAGEAPTEAASDDMIRSLEQPRAERNETQRSSKTPNHTPYPALLGGATSA